MNVRERQTTLKRGEGGYGLLLVIFLITVLLILAVSVAPNILNAGRREREKEMIWRGKQYTRGVKLYFRKMGRFPTSLDDLTKPKIGSLRFMRQAYKDPMNATDGSWRLIYVGPAGQLIGSLKPQQQNVLFPQGVTPANALNGTVNPAQPGTIGQSVQGGTQLGGSNSSTNPTGASGTPAGTDQSDSSSNPQPIPTEDISPIIGGNIIGVGSKINQSSIIVYEHAKNYRLFEFIWDPAKDALGIGQPGRQTGTGLGQGPGQEAAPGVPIPNPSGQQPGQNPPTPPQNPPGPQNPLQ
jgi:type II secretory pathway pseudopilin PulG